MHTRTHTYIHIHMHAYIHTYRRAPNFNELNKNFGTDKVCVAVCGENHFSDQRREEVEMSDFLGWVSNVCMIICLYTYYAYIYTHIRMVHVWRNTMFRREA